MPSVACGVSYIDLNFCDIPRAIATGVYTSDTGVTLITDKPQAGVDSKDTKFGMDACWGTK